MAGVHYQTFWIQPGSRPSLFSGECRLAAAFFSQTGDFLKKPNYSHEKRLREIAKQKKQEEKRQKKEARTDPKTDEQEAQQ